MVRAFGMCKWQISKFPFVRSLTFIYLEKSKIKKSKSQQLKISKIRTSRFKHVKSSKFQNCKISKSRAPGGAPGGVRLARTRKATPYTLRWTQHHTTKVTVTLLIVMKASFFLSHFELFSYYPIYAPLRTPKHVKKFTCFPPPFPPW